MPILHLWKLRLSEVILSDLTEVKGAESRRPRMTQGLGGNQVNVSAIALRGASGRGMDLEKQQGVGVWWAVDCAGLRVKCARYVWIWEPMFRERKPQAWRRFSMACGHRRRSRTEL